MKFRVGEYFALIFISMSALGGLAWLIGGRNIISFAIGAVFGYLLPGIYVARQQAQRLTRFSDQLPDMLNLVVNGLRAGYSTLQALEAGRPAGALPEPSSISPLTRRVCAARWSGTAPADALSK